MGVIQIYAVQAGFTARRASTLTEVCFGRGLGSLRSGPVIPSRLNSIVLVASNFPLLIPTKWSVIPI
jgi:hypothetical protein